MDKFAIMAVDPGGTTGVATGIFNARRARSIRALMKRALDRETLAVEQVEGSPLEQAYALKRAWTVFRDRAHSELALPVEVVFLVIEDFQLRQRSAELSPVQVTWAFLALLEWPVAGTGSELVWHRLYEDLTLQGASEAKTYATDARLREWGLWTVGKEHGRDATRHLALRASKLLT